MGMPGVATSACPDLELGVASSEKGQSRKKVSREDPLDQGDLFSLGSTTQVANCTDLSEICGSNSFMCSPTTLPFEPCVA